MNDIRDKLISTLKIPPNIKTSDTKEDKIIHDIWTCDNNYLFYQLRDELYVISGGWEEVF